VQASATELPFRDDAFAAALAILTVQRVARRRVVVVTWDPSTSGFWLTDDYFPEIVEIDRPLFPSIEAFRLSWGHVEVHPFSIPHDCVDGFLGAYWRRPHAYLDAAVRGAISTFAKLREVEPRLDRLRRDLADGTWARRRGHLLSRSEIDLGYRIVIAPKA
jgi:hypothetical protein